MVQQFNGKNEQTCPGCSAVMLRSRSHKEIKAAASLRATRTVT